MNILEYHGIGKISRIIAWWTRDSITHTSIANDSMTNEWQAWHQGGERFWHGRVDRYDRIGALHTPGTIITVYNWSLTPEQEAKCIEYLDSQRGKKYDFRGIFGFLRRRDTEDPEKLFCSEYGMRASIACGDPLLNADPAKIAPSYLSWSTKLVKDRVIRLTEDGYETL
jgi:hypothetical protein